MKEAFDQIDALYTSFKEDHQKNVEGNKAAGTRARKSLGDIKKLVTEYRKLSIAGNK